MSNPLVFGFIDGLKAIHFPSAGYGVLEFQIELIARLDVAFIDNWTASLSSNYPLIHGNAAHYDGPTFNDPSAVRTNLPFWHKSPFLKNLDNVTTETANIVDRGEYDIITDQGEILFFQQTVQGGNTIDVPFYVDYTGNFGGAPPGYQVLDGNATVTGPNGKPVSLVQNYVDNIGPMALKATTYAPKLINVISSHLVPGASVQNYDRIINVMYLFDLSKIKAAIGPLWKLNIDTLGWNDQIYAAQAAKWSCALSVWKKQKVFPANPDGSLALNYAKADGVNFAAGPLPAEQICPSIHTAFTVNLLTYNVQVQQTNH